MEDQQIIELFFARSQDALVQTEQKYGKKLLQFANGILRNKEDAEECVNDTYLKAWKSIPPNRPQYFYAYLTKICRFLAFGKLDYHKAKKRNAIVVELTAEMEMCIPNSKQQSYDQLINQQEIGRVLNGFLKELSQEKRMIFMRRYWYMDSVVDIANRYQISESKVKTTLFRLRQQLREFLEKEGVSV